MKKFIIVHHLFPYDLENTSKCLDWVLTLMAQTNTESFLKDESTSDSHSDSLYWVLTLTARPTQSLS